MSYSVVQFLAYFINALQFLFVARLIAQLIDQRANNGITRMLITLTEPILAPIRRFIPAVGGLDFSPTIVLVLLIVLRNVILSSV